jgi:hypothetical protein
MKRIRTLAAFAAGWIVLALGSAGAETIKLKNGDELDGKVLERTDDVLVLRHENLGRLEIPTSQLALETSKSGIFGTGLLRGWERRLEVGVNRAQETRTSSTCWGLSLRFGRLPPLGHRGQVSPERGSSGRERPQRLRLGRQRTSSIPGSSGFPFLETRHDYDEFRTGITG